MNNLLEKNNVKWKNRQDASKSSIVSMALIRTAERYFLSFRNILIHINVVLLQRAVLEILARLAQESSRETISVSLFKKYVKDRLQGVIVA